MCGDFEQRTPGTLPHGIIRSHPDPILHKFSKVGNVGGSLVRRNKQKFWPRLSQTDRQRSSAPASALEPEVVLPR